MPDDEGSSLSRRLHWEPEPDPEAGAIPGNASRFEVDSWDDALDEARTEAVATSESRVAAGPSFERRQLDRMDEEALDRRRQLWRDTSLILSGLLVVLILANVVLPELSGTASASPTAAPTGVVVGGLGTPDANAGATPAPVAPPSPSPQRPSAPVTPGITQPPTGTAAPTRPGQTQHPPRPTQTPTGVPPTLTPTPTPEITPEITPIPAPTVHVSCAVLTTLTVSCTSSTTDAVHGSELWAMGGPGTVVTGGDGTDSITFTYDAEGTYHVVLTITGLDGSTKADGTDVTVSAT